MKSIVKEILIFISLMAFYCNLMYNDISRYYKYRDIAVMSLIEGL